MSGIVLSAWDGVLSRQSLYALRLLEHYFPKERMFQAKSLGRHAKCQTCKVSLDAYWISEADVSGNPLSHHPAKNYY